jgi:alpha-L-glutamate ligase-like protein
MFRHLKTAGVLGMNARIGRYMLPHNPRSHYPRVDDKVQSAQLLESHSLPTVPNYFVFASYGNIRRIKDILAPLTTFVIKPARGAMGNGIVVIQGRHEGHFIRASGRSITLDELRFHCMQITSGMYSLAQTPDCAIVQTKVTADPVFSTIAYQGVPDIRIIVYGGYPVMAMLRLPTKESGGRANLHQGAVGAGIDIATGVVIHAMRHNRTITCHPDTGYALSNIVIPFWERILEIASHCYEVTGLGYLGVDIVIDAEHGPLILEMNARPGLSIQVANNRGLRTALDPFTPYIATARPAAERVAIAKRLTASMPAHHAAD